MVEPMTLSRPRIEAFLICRRRFQLRYLERLPWPVAPLEPHVDRARLLGQEFHRLLQRHFLGLEPFDESADDDNPELRQWWATFASQGPRVPAGRRFPELTLTVPLDRHLLTGRFDLLVLAADRAHIYDWKTEMRPQSPSVLRQALQTRLYLALAAESSTALGLADLPPAGISLTYWYVHDPASTVIIAYDQAQHAANWQELTQIAKDIDEALSNTGEWPKTEDLQACRYCAYQVYCNRRYAGPADLAEWEDEEPHSLLEPEQP
jgi:CRISPR/Cas system-associated exonuclease Cas4 (RecB family)